MRRDPAALAVSGAVLYLAITAIAMGTVTFDLWGALIVAPPLAALGMVITRRFFHGRLRSLVLPVTVGLAVKAIGAAGRYWVAFDAYGGSTDAQRYHTYAKGAAASFWNGTTSLGSVLPSGAGTRFLENTAAFVYTFFGSSRLAGFLIFAWMAWFGTVLFLKAAVIGVPLVRRARYAWLLMLWPGIVYWPSSIGKEAVMYLLLGGTSYGFARLLQRQGFWWPVAIAGASLTVAGLIRAHLTFIWLLGLLPALLVLLGRSLRAIGRAQRVGGRPFATALVILFVVVATWSVGNTAVRAIRPSDEAQSFSQSITEVLRETTIRSDEGGSNFTPPRVATPLDWPVAAVRTLTRPLPTEVDGLFQLITALESSALVALLVLNWRRTTAAFHWMVRLPYVALSLSALFAGAVAYSHFANLGILARQRSLLMPFVLMIPCLPEWTPRHAHPVVASSRPQGAATRLTSLRRGT